MKARGLIRWIAPLALLLLLLSPLATWAQTGGLPALTSTPSAGGGQTYTLSIQTLITLTALTFIPAALLMMTSFTRIIIVRAGHSNVTPKSGAGWPRALLDVFYHVTGAGQGLR